MASSTRKSLINLWIKVNPGLSCSSDGKESACNAGDPGFIPGAGRSPGEGNGNPSSTLAWRIPWTEEPGGLQSMGSQQSDTTERLTLLLLLTFERFTFTAYPPYLIRLWPWEEERYILSQVTGKWPAWNRSQGSQDYRPYVHLAPVDGLMDEKTRKFLQLSNLLLLYQSSDLYTQEKIKQ